MPFARNGDVALYWRADGAADRPPLLLLHSIGTDMGLWDPMVARLAQRFYVLRMDLRGHGASAAPAGDYTLAQLAADALAVLDAAGVAKTLVAGISLGGMTAMTLALAEPARVDGLVLACTSAAMDPQAWDARIAAVRAGGLEAVAELSMQRFFSEGFRVKHPSTVATSRGVLTRMSELGYLGCCAAIRDMALADAIAAIATPTLVVTGRHDAATPFAGHGDRLAATIPGATHRQLAAAHLPSLEAPGELAAAIIDFWGEVSGADAGRRAAAQALYDAGLQNRREVLGDAWVDRALANRTDFNADFQAMITRYAWDEIWGRPGLDHRTRRLLVLAITGALGRWEEFRLHVRSGLEQGGFTRDELKETLMQMAIYAGVPAANTAFREAGEVLAELPEA